MNERFNVSEYPLHVYTMNKKINYDILVGTSFSAIHIVLLNKYIQ